MPTKRKPKQRKWLLTTSEKREFVVYAPTQAQALAVFTAFLRYHGRPGEAMHVVTSAPPPGPYTVIDNRTAPGTQMLLLPCLDAHGCRIVVGDEVRSADYKDDIGGRVTKVDGVLIQIKIRWKRATLLPTHEHWTTTMRTARDWVVQR